MFNQNAQINQADYSRALTNFGTQTSVAGLPVALAGNELSLGMSALNGASGINQLGINDYNAALEASQAQSNAQNKAATNMVNSGSVQGSFAANVGSPYGNLAASLGNNISQGNNPFSNIAGTTSASNGGNNGGSPTNNTPQSAYGYTTGNNGTALWDTGGTG
jgi:hypothetical protein